MFFWGLEFGGFKSRPPLSVLRLPFPSFLLVLAALSLCMRFTAKDELQTSASELLVRLAESVHWQLSLPCYRVGSTCVVESKCDVYLWNVNESGGLFELSPWQSSGFLRFYSFHTAFRVSLCLTHFVVIRCLHFYALFFWCIVMGLFQNFCPAFWHFRCVYCHSHPTF